MSFMSYGKLTYDSKAKEVKIMLSELERAALKATAKIVRKAAKANAPVKTGNLKKNIATWVKKKGPDGPHLQIGVYDKARAQRKKLKHAYYAHWLEFGRAGARAANGGRGFLRPAVFDNIDEIRLIQGTFLKEIENENRSKGLIKEEEEVADD